MTSLFQETSLHFINQPFKCLNRIIATHRSFYININDNLGAGRRPQNYFLDGWALDQPAAITIELEITWYLRSLWSNILWHKRKQGRLETLRLLRWAVAWVALMILQQCRVTMKIKVATGLPILYPPYLPFSTSAGLGVFLLQGRVGCCGCSLIRN